MARTRTPVNKNSGIILPNITNLPAIRVKLGRWNNNSTKNSAEDPIKINRNVEIFRVFGPEIAAVTMVMHDNCESQYQPR